MHERQEADRGRGGTRTRHENSPNTELDPASVELKASKASRREEAMADDKSKRGAADRREVSAGEGYEVSYFTKKHGITKAQAEQLIKEHGNNRAKLDAAAEK